MSVENENRSNAAQLLSREPRVFISRPNVRGTLVAVEKAASHSVSLFNIIMWGARSRFKTFQAYLAELLDSQQLIFPSAPLESLPIFPSAPLDPYRSLYGP